MFPPARYPHVLPLGESAPLVLQESVRYLPGRRLVCRATWQNRDVYAKLFFGTRAERDAGRDAAGVAALVEAGVPTPTLLHDGYAEAGRLRVLVFEAVAGSRNAEEIWHSLPEDGRERIALARRLAAAVGMLHQAGLLQRDMYLKNFLVTQAQILTLDGDGIVRNAMRKRMLRNLAVLFSKFPPLFDRHMTTLWGDYSQNAGWAAGMALPSRLSAMVDAERQTVIRKYADSKVLRECTDVHVETRDSHFLAVARSYWQPGVQEMLREPEAFLQKGRCVFLKQGASATVALVEVGGHKLVVKRYNLKTSWKGALRSLRKSRARISWCNAYRLGMYEIATPRPVALIEERVGLLSRRAYYVSEYLAGFNLLSFLRDANCTPEQRSQILGRVAGLLHKLYLAGIEHGDMKGTNLQVGESSIDLIDLDAMKQHRCSRWFFLRHYRDLRRLFDNWPAKSLEREELALACARIYGADWAHFEKTLCESQPRQSAR